MKIDRFNLVVNDQIAYSLSVLAEKGKEYSLGDDRLEHFKDSAAGQGVTPKQALWGMLSKHIASLNGMCRAGSDSKKRWLEKITDSINYLLLLRALVEEDFENGQNRS